MALFGHDRDQGVIASSANGRPLLIIMASIHLHVDVHLHQRPRAEYLHFHQPIRRQVLWFINLEPDNFFVVVLHESAAESVVNCLKLWASKSDFLREFTLKSVAEVFLIRQLSQLLPVLARK
jgi:hypothetical protein